jgi:hypothetical protein
MPADLNAAAQNLGHRIRKVAESYAAKDIASSAQDRHQDKIAEQKGIGANYVSHFADTMRQAVRWLPRSVIRKNFSGCTGEFDRCVLNLAARGLRLLGDSLPVRPALVENLFNSFMNALLLLSYASSRCIGGLVALHAECGSVGHPQALRMRWTVGSMLPKGVRAEPRLDEAPPGDRAYGDRA